MSCITNTKLGTLNKVLQTRLDADDYELFIKARQKINLSEYAFAKQAIKKAIREILFNETGALDVSSAKLLTLEEKVIDVKNALEKEITIARRKEHKLFDEASTVKRSGMYNPSLAGGTKIEHESLGAINFKREMLAQKMAVLRVAIATLERIEHKDWAGLENSMPPSVFKSDNTNLRPRHIQSAED